MLSSIEYMLILISDLAIVLKLRQEVRTNNALP